MNDANKPPSSDTEREAQKFALENVAAKGLGISPQEVSLINSGPFIENKTRFLYGFTQSPEKPAGFFKMAQTEENNKQLERESVGLQIARRVGIPTVGVLHPYQTIEGKGVVHVEKLDAECGTVLTGPELIAAADPKYGARAVVTLKAASGKEIPNDIDSSVLKRGDWRNKSPETFWKVWDEQNNAVFDAKNTAFVEKLVGVDKLRAMVDETKSTVEPTIEAAQNPDVEYFVHNDTALSSTQFFKQTLQTSFLDIVI